MATLKKLDNGKYEVRYDSMNPATGKRTQHRKRFDRYKDANAFKVSAEDQINKGTYNEPSSITLAEWLDQWLTIKTAESALEQATIENYQWGISKIKQHLGGYRLQGLNPTILEQFLYITLRKPLVDGIIRKKTWALLGSDRTRLIQLGDRGILVMEAKTLLNKEGYYEGEIDRDYDDELEAAVRAFQTDRNPPAFSNKSLRHVYTVLSGSLSAARRKGLLFVNPMEDVAIPKLKKRDLDVPDAEETAAMLKALEDEEVYIPTLLAVTCGLRRSETLGLQWDDINCESLTLTIRRAIVQTKKGIITKDPKNEYSRRLVAMPQFVATALSKWKETLQNNKKEYGANFHDSNRVCVWPDGRPWKPDSLSQSFERALKRHGLREITFHGLRHTHTSILLDSGVGVKLVSERLGHSSVETTLDIYTHVLKDRDRQAADALDKHFATRNVANDVAEKTN